MYNHVPESVLKNENCKLLWDFMISIQADHHIEARRLDLSACLQKQEKLSCNRRGNSRRQWSKRKGGLKGWNVSKSGQRTEKNVGSENQSHTNCIGGLRNSAVAIEGQLKGYRSRHINYFNPEVCTAGISKDIKKSIGNVKDRTRKHFGVPWQLVLPDTTIFLPAVKNLGVIVGSWANN